MNPYNVVLYIRKNGKLKRKTDMITINAVCVDDAIKLAQAETKLKPGETFSGSQTQRAD